MPALKKPEHERFAQAIARGKTLGAAYVAAGYKLNDKNAARLKKNDGVSARIQELQEKAAAKAVVTAADIARQLDEDRAFARGKANPSAAVSATMGKAKVLGLIIDHSKIGFDLSSLTEEELELLERLQSRLTKPR